MHLVSLRAQTVQVAGQTIRFAAGETIHTENSYKHTIPGFAALAEAAGWQTEAVWTDPAGCSHCTCWPTGAKPRPLPRIRARRANLPLNSHPGDSPMDSPATPAPGEVTDRNLALELVRVTEAAALAASRWIGLGKKNEADGAAVEAMRRAFDTVAIAGTVVIGEGEMDEAPMLYHRREGRRRRAARWTSPSIRWKAPRSPPRAARTRIAIVALAEHGNFLHAPDIYMDKIAVGGGLPDGVVDLDAPVGENLRNLARAKNCEVSDLVACILDRDRHKELIAKTPRGRRPHHADQRRRRGRRDRHRHARQLRSTSTSAPAARRKACWPPRRCAASAARCRDGCCSRTTTQIERARDMGITDPKRKFTRRRKWPRAT